MVKPEINRILLLFLVTSVVGCSTPNLLHSDIQKELEAWLALPVSDRAPIENLHFSKKPLTKAASEHVTGMLHKDKQHQLVYEFGEQWDSRQITYKGMAMPFYYQKFGDEPSDGRSLFISLHGGGNTKSSANDRQYENQKHLYDTAMSSLEGIYLAARAPTNTWNLWHENHIDDFFNLLIQLSVAMEHVNPNKVYLLGYSAGGDGVYQLAPRMADRWAAASMMAGHPNETSPLGLKTLPFALHMGALDAAYDRNKKAHEWKIMLDSLEAMAPGTYIHQVVLHEGRGHWMQLDDAIALPWMSTFKRNPTPEKIFWKQDDRHHRSFYWLGVPDNLIETGGEVVAEYNASMNEINILSNYSDTLEIYLNDKMMDLDKPVSVRYRGKVIGEKAVNRSLLSIYKSLSAKGDPALSFPSMLTVVKNEEIAE
nr:alpha/beta hydrolase [Cytophagales bacterium]